ncbi:phosphate signaling complex protein PhoU [Lyngbya confervoides]|uniref:phosphate signaling complex protein PhoU n=1 Tax=Lyngbya confervoides TaxID=207921 RepID=UPI001F3FB89D|nr:phosphate signaling complex protein PhoU [Lyngbya confervoides]
MKPIRKQFDQKLTSIQNDVLRMGALVEQSCCLAHQALFKHNLAVIDELKHQEQKIDRLYRQIETDCLQFMALQSPVATDLRLIGTLMQMVRDLERIGDYAEDLTEFAVKLLPYDITQYSATIENMLLATQSMLAMGLASLTELDAEQGLNIKQRDDEVDSGYQQVYQKLSQVQTVQGSVEPLLLMMLTIRSIERMADHATNIGRRVAYIVTGQR